MTATLFLAYDPERHRRRFLEIIQDGTRLTLRGGRLGQRAKVTVRDFPSPAAAARELERLATLSFEQGYEQVV